MRMVLCLWYLALCFFSLQAQDSSGLTISAYGEPYFTYDFSRPSSHTRPTFMYSHHRTGEVAINLALVRLAFTRERTRANLGLMAGTYANANLAAEPGVLKNLFEANAGYRLSKTKAIWADAGVLPSHIGWEGAIGKDNWTLTRSLAADNSPYYEAGIRFSYSSLNQQWYFALLLLNGWQRMQRVEGNQTMGWGWQVTFKPTGTITFNSSSFVGSDLPDSTRRMRYFHNGYAIIELSEQVSITLGLDVGAQQKEKGASTLHYWYTPVALLRGRIGKHLFATGRVEHYKDRYGIIINQAPFALWGYSANLDWQLTPHLQWRVEAKWMKGRQASFTDAQGRERRTNTSATTALCFSF